MPHGTPESPLAERIGPYRIERLLGRGGMGSVYLAVREDDYQQQVALKLVSRDAGGDEIIGRFYTERQILAGLQHPGIARLLDGGVSDDGWPYFAMEYVEGERIDRYCDQYQLSLRERLQLFRKVCDAVQFAHQNLVVHRDIKPGNILVTTDGSPRLLDFGIAKVLQTEQVPAATLSGMAPMTPSYASPEQILNQPITTACDVYALGMLLYRLLAGRAPYLLDGLGFQEIVEVICHREPVKPSVAVLVEETPWEDERPTELTEETNAQHLSSEGTADTTLSYPTEKPLINPGTAGRLAPPAGGKRRRSRQLVGDLDAITLKALRKEPRDRYGSAAEFAEDLRRYLVGLPVAARQWTWFYSLGKFLRRNQLGLAILTVIAGLAVSTTLLWRQAVTDRAQAELAKAQAELARAKAEQAQEQAEQAQEQAEHQQALAEEVTQFLERLFQLANPDETQGELLTVYEILRRGRTQVLEELEPGPEIRAEILGTLASVYGRLGRYDEAVELREEALEARKASDTTDRPELAKDTSNLAYTLYDLGDYPGAEQYFRDALAIRQRLKQSELEIANNLLNLAATLAQRGVYSEAEEFHRRVLATYLEEVGTSLYSLGALALNRGDFEGAEPLLRQALEIRIVVLEPRHTLVARVLNGIGMALHGKGELEEAQTAYQEALSIRQERLGEDHARIAQTQKNLAELLLEMGNITDAGELIHQALETLRRSMPEGSVSILDAERVMGAYLLEKGLYSEAEQYLMRSFHQLREIRGDQALPTQNALNQLIALYEISGQSSEAEKYRAIARQLQLQGVTERKGS